MAIGRGAQFTYFEPACVAARSFGLRHQFVVATYCVRRQWDRDAVRICLAATADGELTQDLGIGNVA